jgi:hypothetical protein
MEDKKELYIIYALIIISLLLIYIYIYVMVIHSPTKHISLNTLGIDTFLTEGNVKKEIMRTYLNPHYMPYINIAVSYPSDKKPIDLNFQIFDEKNKEVSYNTVTLNETETHKSVRIYFQNNGSKYYTLNYTLPVNANNFDTINIMFVELKI